MKRNLFFLFLLAFMTIATVLQAQAPQAVTLQSVLRDAAGRLVANRNVGVQITLRQGSAMGSIVYQETHTPTTNQNGLYTVFFGQGTPTSGTFAGIDWASGPYYATVAADPNGGNNYTLTVNHPIVSVPYALYAEQAKEMQVLAYSNDTLYLRGGNTTTWVYLPAGGGGGGGPVGCVPSCGKVDTIRHQLDSLINLSCLATVHYVTQSACDSFTWPVNGQKYLLSGTYTYTRARGNAKGCDSIEMMMLTINHSSHNVEKQNVTGFLTWHGTTRSTSGTYTYSYNNSYSCPSVDTLKLTVNTAGSLPGEFSVSATKKVRFSKGNLQHQASSGKWRFAEHQYDAIMNLYGNTNMGQTNTYYHDLFGWGTSGHQNLADPLNYYYRPWNNSTGETGNGFNRYGYGPSTNMIDKNLTGASDINDWGVPNAISNGGLQTGKWRVLTTAEWNDLFMTRPVNVGRFCFAQIMHIQWLRGDGAVNSADYTQNGIIILPDNFVYPAGVSALNNLDDWDYGWYTNNPISLDGWAALEAAGAVFLPAAGFRQGNDVYSPNSYGRYWSSTYINEYYAYSVFFHNSSPTRYHLLPQASTYDEGYWSIWPNNNPNSGRWTHSYWNSRRFYGMSVRLVQDIN